MFLVERNVPEVYREQSRDFQLFSRLYDLVFQSTRYSIDSMDDLTDTLRCNESVLKLVGTKVGFFDDLRLEDRDRRLLLSAFPYIIKCKGSLKGLNLAANLVSRLTNTDIKVSFMPIDAEDPEKGNKIVVEAYLYTPKLDLLYSLFRYVCPTGASIEWNLYDYETYYAEGSVSDTVKYRNVEENNTVTNDTSDVENPATVGFARVINQETEDEQ